MLQLDANIARFHFTSAGLDDPGTFQVVQFEGAEEISQLFHFKLHLVSERPDIDFARVVNKPATFTMMSGVTPLPIHGLVIDLEQLGRSPDFVEYRVVLAPRLWRLSLNYRSRIFQNLSVPDIIEEVLKDEHGQFTGDDYRFLTGSYPPREYCVQYQETDLAFIRRLMEFEGICFFFEHDTNHERLVMSDDQGQHPAIAAMAGRSALAYRQSEGLVDDPEAVQEFVCREKIVTGTVVLKDYNYETPNVNLKTPEKQLNEAMPGIYYEYGPHYKDENEGNRLAQVRNEEIECGRRILSGASGCLRLRNGYRFDLKGHYRRDLDTKYMLTKIMHRGSQRKALGLAGVGGYEETGENVTYRAVFTCIPADVPYRPPRLTPQPSIPGVMTARIEKTGGPYAELDPDGRYHARMHFDLRTKTDREDATATKPIRMVQPYSGAPTASKDSPKYGFHFPNHAGTEMVWACVDGHIDRPIALGTVPNMEHLSPSTFPNRMQNVIRTWNDNELTFDDNQGNERIFMHATKDHIEDVVNDQTIKVGHDRTKTVGNDEKNTIQNNRTTDVVKGHETLTVHTGDRSVTVGKGDDTHTVEKGRKTDTIEGPYEIGVHKDRFEVICGKSRITLFESGRIEIYGKEIEMRATGPITINGKIVDIN